MSFSPDDVDHLARLSRLQLDDDERRALAGDLERIVGYVELLQEVSVEGIEPMTHAIAMTQRERTDEASDDVKGRAALAGSAGYQGGVVRVPRVIE